MLSVALTFPAVGAPEQATAGIKVTLPVKALGLFVGLGKAPPKPTILPLIEKS